MPRDDDDLAKTFDFSEVDDEAPAEPTPAVASAALAANPAANAGLLAGGVALLGGGALALVGVVALCAGLWFASSSSEPPVAEVDIDVPDPIHPSGCPIGQDGPIGWVRTDSMKIRKGRVHTLSRDTPLFTRSGGTEVVCTLPPGTSIYAAKSTRTNVKGAWLQVYGTAVTLPE